MKSNLYKKLRTFAFTAGLVCVSVYAMTNAAGPPAENTGAPGDNTCGQSACHNFTPISSGTLWNNITMTSNIPASGYVPGTAYSVTISHAQPGHSVFGFQATFKDVNGINAGSITAGTGTATQTSNGKVYINHTSGGTSGIGGKSWTFTWTAPNTGIGTITTYVAVNCANGDANNTGDTIFTKGFVIYQTGTAPPTATISADKSSICQFDTVTFTGGGANNPTSYSWGFPGGTPINGTSSSSQNPVVVFSGSFAGSSITRTITLNTSNANGTSLVASVPLFINAAPSATTTPTLAVSICGNDSLTITAPSGTGYAYLWSPGNSTGQTYVAKNSGTYKVRVTNTATGCARTKDSIVVTKRTLPVVTLTTSTDSICAGDSVTFTASAGMNNYDFYLDTIKIKSGAASSYKVPPTNTKAYTVYGTDAFGCKSLVSNSKAINIQLPLAAPTLTCGTSTLTSLTFNWTAVTNATGYEVSIDSGKTWIAPSSGATGLTHTVNGLASATRVNLRSRATQSTGKCSKGDFGATTCQTTGCVPVTFNLTYDSLFCNPVSTDSATIVVGNVNTAKYSVKVDLVNSVGTFISSIYPYSAGNSFKIKVNSTFKTYYRFTVLDSNQLSCSAGTTVINIQGVIAPATTPILTFGKPNTTLCDNETAVFSFNTPTGTDRYDVLKNNVSLGKTVNTSVTYPASTFANNDIINLVAINDATGCGKKSLPFTITRKATPHAAFTVTTADSTRAVQFADITTGANAWNWKFGEGASSSTLQNPSHTYSTNGPFNVTLSVKTTDLCNSDTATKSVSLHTGLVAIEGIGQVQFYPNPVKSLLTIELTNIKADENVTFILTDIQGRVMKTNMVSVNHSTYTMDLTDLVKAPYMLVIKAGQIQKAFPIIKD